MPTATVTYVARFKCRRCGEVKKRETPVFYKGKLIEPCACGGATATLLEKWRRTIR